MTYDYEAIFNNWESRLYFQKNTDNADEVEANAIKLGSSTFEFGSYDNEIADELDPVPHESLSEDWADDDCSKDSLISDISLEICRRKSILGELYPFRVTNTSIHHQPSNSSLYEFFLAICRAPNITSGHYTELPVIFEEIAAILSEAYLGQDSSSLRTGWPRNGSLVRFKQIMIELNRRAKDWNWSPSKVTRLAEDPDPKYVKDEGLDFVAWKNFPDNRNGKLFLLGQCACGNNWNTKGQDISIKKLEKWFDRPMTHVDPVRAFMTPRHIIDSCISEHSKEAGLTFDRVRLIHLANKNPGHLDKISNSFGSKIQTFVEEILL